MKERKKIISGILAALTMFTVILDTKTAIRGAEEGITLCLHTVIPSLFPFFILSGIINSRIGGLSIRPIRPLARICRIPNGAESILLLGFTAGYPVGAQLIYQCYSRKQISADSANRMLGFCNNAGPAFLFGMLSPLFENPIIPWLLWGIHIVSAIIVGVILPGAEKSTCKMQESAQITLFQSIQNALRITATVSGWVIIFRIILAFCSRWFLWILPPEIQVLFSGFLELSNGCILLKTLPQEGLRFIFASCMLAFGGICVGLQTMAVTGGLRSGMYFPGKGLQVILSLLLSILIQPILFESTQVVTVSSQVLIISTGILFFSIYLIRRKKVVAFKRRMLYNTDN